MIYARKRTTGYYNTDSAIDDIYEILNTIEPSSSTTTPGEIIRTPEGGYGFTMSNGGGTIISKGFLVSGTSTDNTIITAPIDSYNIIGVAYDDISVYGSGLIIFFGLVDVYFDSGGASSGDYYFRVTKSNDSSPTAGVAHSESTDRIDRGRLLGFPIETKTSEGLARCVLKR